MSGLTVAEQKEAISQQGEDERSTDGLTDQKDGIAIEINNPLQPVRHTPCPPMPDWTSCSCTLEARTVFLTDENLQLGKSADKLSQSVFSKVVEKVPAASAGAVRVYLKVPEMLLERTSKLATINQKGTAVLGQEFSFQLAAQQATVDFRVRTANVQVRQDPELKQLVTQRCTTIFSCIQEASTSSSDNSVTLICTAVLLEILCCM